ncbi:MAG TPA: hypothetical protein VGQ08_17805 [Nitrospiraceae bacterium]|jgi:hypothetical protein|nr:hypothetical protein [Nitrospiraceae bacterium]
MATKRELQDENDRLRERLEEAYDIIGEALGFDDESEENESGDEDGELDESDR